MLSLNVCQSNRFMILIQTFIWVTTRNVYFLRLFVVVVVVFDATTAHNAVMFVEKVLQGPLEDVHAPYINIEGQKMKKSFVKFTDRMKDACNSFSKVCFVCVCVDQF
jgi:hypothetical protein